MSAPSVAVVIPTLNRSARLRRCLEAILCGDMLPQQIAVCDQGTDEATHAVVASLATGGAQLTYLRLPVANASGARNAGLEAVSTELVAFIDDDCLPAPRWVAALIEAYCDAAALEPVSAVTGRVMPERSTRGGVATSSRVSTEKRHFRARGGGLARGEWAPWDAGTGGNMLASRTTLRALGGFDPRLGPGTATRAAEDIDLLYRLAKVGTIVYEPEAVVYHPTSTRGRRLASRFRYGFGMGAMLARHIARGDRTARRLLSLYVRHQLAEALRRGAWGPVESLLTVAGLSIAIIRRKARGSGSGMQMRQQVGGSQRRKQGQR